MFQLEVTFTSGDVPATQRLLGRGLGLARLDDRRYAVGEAAITIAESTGGPTGVSTLTLHGDGGAETIAALAAKGYSATDSYAGPEVVVEGVRIRLDSALLDIHSGDHTFDPAQLTASRIDHMGVASDNSIQLSKVLDEVLGFSYESRQVDTQLDVPIEMFSSDKYGVVSHAQQPKAAGALLVSFLTHPGGDFELLEDIMPAARTLDSGPGSTTGDNKAIANFVQRRGAGLHHVAFRVADMAASIAQLKDAGVVMIDDRGRPGSRRAQIAFVDRRSTGGSVVHLVERPDHYDPSTA